jgi:tetratricopeptide (TPR) repeat protein
MNCEDYRASIVDLLEGDVDAVRRTALDAHAASCDACRALAADLRRIAQTAATLDRHAPPRDGWTRVAQRLSNEPGFAGAAARHGRVAPPLARLSQQWTWLAVAAALIMAVGVTLVFFKRGLDTAPRTEPARVSNAAPNDLVESVESELQLAADHYEKAISALEQVANQSDSPLDAEVMATVRQNLGVIDKAIDDSRTALRSQPDSQLAQESLFDAFRRKVSLLQDTIALMNEMRKGNQAGAARIGEANKS